MEDRAPLYPGRVKLTPVAGTTDKFDMEMADEPSVEGTPLNKANLLSDETAAALGIQRQQLSTFSVGDTIKLKVNGTPTDFIVVHQGKPSSMYDDSCDGTWLLMKDCYESRAWHSSNANSYKDSTIHNYLNSTFFDLFDSNIKSAVKQVKIPYVNGTGSSPVASGSDGLSANVFLLSGYEVGFTTSVNQYFPIDGAKLDYFVSGNDSTAQAKRVANLNGSASIWWLRSPSTVNASYAWYVSSNGGCYYGSCASAYGVRPALVLPSAKYYDPNGYAVYDTPALPTPNEAFSKIADALKGLNKTNIICGSYIGSGTRGESNKNSVIIPFKPKIFMIFGNATWSSDRPMRPYVGIFTNIHYKNEYQYDNYAYFTIITSASNDTSLAQVVQEQQSYGYYESGRMYWWNGVSALAQLNVAGASFDWVAIG